MRNSHVLSALAVLVLSAGLAQAQWTGPFAPDSRLIYNTGPVYVGGVLDTSRFNVTDDATSRIIGFHSFIGTPVSGVRTTALWGETNNPKGRGLQGFNFATAASGDANNPATGIWAETASVTGQGIRARATSATGSNYGGFFDTASSGGVGVFGTATSSSGPSIGVWGNSVSPNGFAGYFTGSRSYFEGQVGIGTGSPVSPLTVVGTITTGGVIRGTNDASSGGFSYIVPAAGVLGLSSATTPGNFTAGVVGLSSSTTSTGYGVLGHHAGTGIAVLGATDSGGYGIYGTAPGGWGGYFEGNVNVVGTLSKGGGSFKIDHPLDPENKLLYHSFVESPDMMNIYNGVISTDASGNATITMPEWFEALNQEFRYQLTIIDEVESGWAMAKVVSRIKDNQFSIRTNLPNQMVSWQVTGIRHDAWAQQNRIPVEVEKSQADRGLYLHPAAFGLPPERGSDYRRTHSQAGTTTADAAAKPAAKPVRSQDLPGRPVPSSDTPPLVPAVQGGR